MLTEVSCELFKVNGQVRQPIRFHKGLNIILGGKTGVRFHREIYDAPHY